MNGVRTDASIHGYAQVHDEAIVNGRRYNGDGSNIIGSVEVIYRSKKDGKVIFSRDLRHNDLLVTGAVFMSEKNNNMRSTFKTVPLDLELGVHTAEEIISDHTTIGAEQICGLMVGNGGAGDVYNAVYKTERASRSVPGPVPFRVVPVAEDLPEATRARYFLRVVRGEYIYYYGKNFDMTPEIIVEYEDGTTVPTDVDTSVVTKFIKTYTRYRVTIDQSDIREYFKITQGSTLRSLINSLGLVTGYPGDAADGKTEYFNVRGTTSLNMENKELKDSESTITVIYKLFIQ